MNPAELIAELTRDGVRLWEEGGKLRYRAPAGTLGPDRVNRLREHRDAVLTTLREQAAMPVAVVPDLDARLEPFPLTDVQAAYLVGRGDVFDHGGVACHVYLEIGYPDLEPSRVEAAWNRMIARHDMLRVRISQDGHQRVLPQVGHLDIPAVDLRSAPEAAVVEGLERVRADMSHRVYDTETWPLFGLAVTRTPTGAVLHLSMDFLVADWASLWLLLREFEILHAEPDTELPVPELTFRDYVLAERRLRDGDAYLRAREYWWDRVDTLPPAPQLPFDKADPAVGPRFRRRTLLLDATQWAGLTRRAADHGITASAAVLTAYAAALERWSRSDRFTLNLTVLNRLPLHPDVDEVVGDFTSVSLLEVDGRHGTFGERASRIAARLFDDLDHRLCSGIEVLREIARRRGRDAALMPIVFTSAIGLGQGGTPVAGRLDGTGVTQTPQVFVDCQAMDGPDGLQVNWDVRDGVFRPGVVDDMFAAFETLLRELATDDVAWSSADPVPLPAWQLCERAAVNATAGPLPTDPLHAPVVDRARSTPDAIAVIDATGPVTYAELVARASGVAEALRARGIRRGDRVGVTIDKSIDQVAAVLGVLLAGAVYLPLDTTWPALRRSAVLAAAGVRVLLTQGRLRGDPLPDGVSELAVDGLPAVEGPVAADQVDVDEPAYVIYTSGSTGAPKGVVVSHRAAANTVQDVNRRFDVGPADRVLALAQLGFDLSVYDLFGLLGAGGSVVLPDPRRGADPSHWADLVAGHGVTVWNSVPALMEMFVGYLCSDSDAAARLAAVPPRLALLSGDWIPVPLAGRMRAVLPGVAVVGLGGATEAAIWSNVHPIGDPDPDWPSVPYGTPLTNQGFRVLDDGGRDCAVWTVGELHISGAGLAEGYLGDAATTAQRFIVHPDGQRLYRTGDLGRYRPGGMIEFLGREDDQVKIRGHRIELGEIESVLTGHPDVAAAAVAVDDRGGERGLLGVVVPATASDPPPDLRAAELAARAADREVRGVTREQVTTYAEAVDDAVLESMARALTGLGATGIGTVGEVDAEVPDAVDPRHRWLARRWFALLSGSAAGRAAAERAAGGRSTPDWTRVARAWDGLGPPAFLDYLRHSTELLAELLTGSEDPARLLLPGGGFDVVDAMYTDNVTARYLNRAVATVAHRIAAHDERSGPLRVLEVGAGTGSTTADVVAALEPFDVEYRFTDVSPFFLPRARERFGHLPWMSFGLYDVDLDARAQGLAPNAFDIVIAAGVLENARDVGASAANLRELVAPGGWLVLTEPTREHPWILASQAFMMTPPEDERRRTGPSYLDRAEWVELIRGLGAGETVCLPEDDHALAPQGLHLIAARLKGDRARVDVAGLVEHLGERLPAHMVPSHLQVVDRLPLTSNGKVDRRALAGWRPACGPDVPDTGPDSDDPFERRLAGMWAEVLALHRVGRLDDLVARGADSLITARMAGRLREELPEVAGMSFDLALRTLLNNPTVAGQAAALRERDTGADPGARRSNAALVPFGADPTGSTGGSSPSRFLFHAGLGTMECYRPLAAELVAQDLGPVTGVVIDDPDVYCELDEAEVVERLADDYTERIVERIARTGHERIQLVGYCLGGMYAVEVARRLAERGHDLADLVLVSSHPVLFDVQDDLMIESLFAPNLGLTPSTLGFGELDSDDMVRAFMTVLEASGGRIPNGALVTVGGDQGLDAVGAFYRRMAATPQPERLAGYAAAASAAAGSPMRPELVCGMFRVFRQSFRSARFTPEAYAGDIRFLRPAESSGFAPGMDDMTLRFWDDVCVGEFSVTAVGGDHFSCINPPHVTRVAELVAQPLRAEVG